MFLGIYWSELLNVRKNMFKQNSMVGSDEVRDRAVCVDIGIAVGNQHGGTGGMKNRCKVLF